MPEESDTYGDQFIIRINTLAMHPFVATVAPAYNKKLDYAKIKAARVCAMAFYGGELYDAFHREKTYVNPNLEALTTDCNNAAMPYLVYVNVRARSTLEADKECNALYYIIAHYPPKLGVWMCIKNNNPVSLNDEIVEVYCKYFEKWGIKTKCGFYVTPAELEKITWVRFQSKLSLWLIQDGISIFDVDDELLDPRLFEVPY